MKATLLIASLLLIVLDCKKYFVRYDQFAETILLFKYFYDVTDGYYVDIGAYDPMMLSNTLFMYHQGWNGINLEASPERFRKFLTARNRDLNLNMAVGTNESYVTFYDFAMGVVSTLNPGVKNSLQKSKFQYKETKVPAMTMSELCHRYYEKKPNYMNLDVQGFSTFALEANDWKTQKCKPEIITVEINRNFNTTNVTSPQDILAKYGYKYHKEVQLSQVWIQGSVYEKYTKKFQEGEKVYWTYHVLNLVPVLDTLYKHLGMKEHQFNDQLNNKINPLYFYFPKWHETLVLENLNLESNLISEKKDRPIVILGYNPDNMIISAGEGSMSETKLEGKEANFTRLDVKTGDGRAFQVFILGFEYKTSSNANINTNPNSNNNKNNAKTNNEQETLKSQAIIQQMQQKWQKAESRAKETKSRLEQAENKVKRLEDNQRDMEKNVEEQLALAKRSIQTKAKQLQLKNKETQLHLQQITQKSTQLQSKTTQIQTQLSTATKYLSTHQNSQQNMQLQQIKVQSYNYMLEQLKTIIIVILIAILAFIIASFACYRKVLDRERWNERIGTGEEIGAIVRGDGNGL